MCDELASSIVLDLKAVSWGARGRGCCGGSFGKSSRERVDKFL